MDLWKGDLQLPEGRIIKDVHLSRTEYCGPSISIPPFSLTFLALVDIAHIPLYLAVGPSVDVWTECSETEDWFSAILLHQDRSTASKDPQWWNAAGSQSLLGILCRVPQSEGISQYEPTITEILFYGAVSPSAGHEIGLSPTATSRAPDRTLGTIDKGVSQSPQLRVRALTLSSDLLYRLPSISTPPLSPNPGHAEFAAPRQIDGAQSLPRLFLSPEEDSNPLKRRDLPDVFEQAAERRKSAKRKGGESVAAAASRVDGSPVLPSHRRSLSVDKTPQVHTAEDTRKIPHVTKTTLENAGNSPKNAHAATSTGRPLSRSSSLSLDNRPRSRRCLLDKPTKRSSLSRVTGLVDFTEESNIESRNKNVISRLVMAGMRLYGLQQSKASTSIRHASVVSSPAGFDNDVTQETPEDASKNEEYKLIYHHTYKGAVFAFRNHLVTNPLHLQLDRLRETVDKLLAIYCGDPLLSPEFDLPSTDALMPTDQGESSAMTGKLHADLGKMDTP